jgi:hypothetical protein
MFPFQLLPPYPRTSPQALLDLVPSNLDRSDEEWSIPRITPYSDCQTKTETKSDVYKSFQESQIREHEQEREYEQK